MFRKNSVAAKQSDCRLRSRQDACSVVSHLRILTIFRIHHHRTLNLLSEEDQLIELRILNVTARHGGTRTLSGYFNDYLALAKAAITGGKAATGTYITLNPIDPALLARGANRLQVAGKNNPLTSDGDVTKRRWLPIDLDPVRLSGISSTDEEHELSIERAYQIRDCLRGDGWPDPVVADSGNGSHLLYRVDVAANDDGLIKRSLQALASRFDDDRVKVDQTVFNPGRIWKLYGTLTRKGDSTLDRRHRLSRILEAA